MSCERTILHTGAVVRVNNGGRHDATTFPFAVLVEDGNPVSGGGWRYKALFVNDVAFPTKYGYGNLYDDECIAYSELSVDTLCAMLAAANKHWDRIKMWPINKQRGSKKNE